MPLLQQDVTVMQFLSHSVDYLFWVFLEKIDCYSIFGENWLSVCGIYCEHFGKNVLWFHRTVLWQVMEIMWFTLV